MSRPIFSALTAALLGGAVVLCSSICGAQPVVDAHLQRGVELRREGRDTEAVVEFESAYRIAPTPRTAGQLGLALQASGDWVRGYEMVREALTTPADAWVTRNRGALQQAISAAEQHVGLLDLRGGVVGARVFLDGHALGTLPMAREQPILAGRHALEIRADNEEPISREIVVRAGEINREVVDRSPVRAVGSQGTNGSTSGSAGSTTPVNNSLRAAPSWPWFSVGLGVGGVGIAVLVLGGIFDAISFDDAANYNGPRQPGEGICPPPPTQPPAGVCTTFAQQFALHQGMGVGLLVGGGILLAGGIVIVALPRPSAVSSARVTLRPTLGGVLIGGIF